MCLPKECTHTCKQIYLCHKVHFPFGRPLLFKVGVFSTCDATDQWSWTAQGSLQYKKKMCLVPKTGRIDPVDNIVLMLGSACNESKNFFKFVPSKYLYITLCT